MERSNFISSRNKTFLNDSKFKLSLVGGVTLLAAALIGKKFEISLTHLNSRNIGIAGGVALSLSVLCSGIYWGIFKRQETSKAGTKKFAGMPAVPANKDVKPFQVGSTSNPWTGWWSGQFLKNSNCSVLNQYKKSLQKGCVVRFTAQGGSLEGIGGVRQPGEELEGIPQKHPDSCPFCSSNTPAVQEFEQCRLIASHSNTPLLIPSQQPIPIHWFQADESTQILLLQAAQQVLDHLQTQLRDSTFWLELHCGSPGYQTVWHLHLRIHRKKGWSGIDWKSLF